MANNTHYKLGDRSKAELLQLCRNWALNVQQLEFKMKNVATGFQAMACELRKVDKQNAIFTEKEGVLMPEQLKVIDKFLENGEYDQYREARKKEHLAADTKEGK